MKKPKFQTLLLLFASLVLVAGLAASCGGDDDDDDNGGADPTATSEPNGNGNGDDNGNGGDDVDEIEISMQDNFFEPADITIPAGKTVKIEVKNDGMAIHNMVVLGTDFKSDAMVNSGEESSFEVMFEEPGTYDFQCDYHVPDMVGTITVE